MNELQTTIEQAWEDRELLKTGHTQEAIRAVLELLDKGKVRVAEPTADGEWKVNDWVKKAVVLYFPIQKMETMEVGIFEFHDKIPLKKNYKELGVRVVPHAIARHGAFLAPGVIMMPSYVNLGAYVDSGTMVDTWATVGSCGQIGKNVHLRSNFQRCHTGTAQCQRKIRWHGRFLKTKTPGKIDSVFNADFA